ncbi:hypothetical protein [Mucilaginibacter sp.]|uniref:hypothetical protein n=1 Tax=Mucilaginibacter sp. TaxID=1882438 RepID=UPI0032663609
MLFKTHLQEKSYQFEVTPLSDLENGKIFFFIQLLGGNSILAEKCNPGGKWSQVKGGMVSDELRQVVFDEIDHALFSELMKDIMPLGNLSN